MGKRKRVDKKKLLFYICAVIAVIIAGVSRSDFANINNNLTLDDNSVAVYFLDVGQGSCTVVQSGNEAVLIDAGEREYSTVVIDFLKDKGISKLQSVVVTHPHSDHMGGVATVLEYIETEEIYFPYIIDKYAPTSKSYLNLLETVDRHNIAAYFIDKITAVPFSNTVITLIPPEEQVRNFNNMSLLTKVDYGNTSVMLLADAENKELNSILKSNALFDFSCDIYLVPHHGSNTSLCDEFLSRLESEIAVISCGKDNSYGHPHIEVENYLKKNNIKFFRTDINGTITFITDGNEYNITTEKGD